VKEKTKERKAEKEETQTPKPEGVPSKADHWAKFRRRFPHLAKELEGSPSHLRIDGVRWEEPEHAPETSSPSRGKLTGYSPDPIDFIRRCKTEEQALEIIAFLEERKEIDKSYADSLRHQLKTRGLASFGPRKTWGHYERQG
jgi:hypothetical protein